MKESPYIFSKFNPLNTDTLLIFTLSMAPSVAVLTGLECTRIIQIFVFFLQISFFIVCYWNVATLMNQLIVVFLPSSDCHFLMRYSLKTTLLVGSFVHRSHVFRLCEDRGKGSTSFQGLFSFETFLRKKALEMRLGEGAAGPGRYLDLRPNYSPQRPGKLFSRPVPLLIWGLQASLHFLKISIR